MRQGEYGRYRKSVDMSQTDFPVVIDDRYFENYQTGFECVYGTLVVTESEVLEFGRNFLRHGRTPMNHRRAKDLNRRLYNRDTVGFVPSEIDCRAIQRG